jgi:TPR repeat protein
MKRLLAVIICGLIGAAPAAAQDLTSLEQLRATAARGDAAAQLEMGILYEYGFDLPNNRAYALAWYSLAAERGNSRAVERRDLLQRRLPEIEIAEARRLASELAAGRVPETNTPTAQDAPSRLQ